MVQEKDAQLVQRMDQLAGAISMSRLEISGHLRAKERAEARRRAALDESKVKVEDAAALFRWAAREEGKGGGRADVAEAASRHGVDEATARMLLRYCRHADAVEVEDRTVKGGVKLVKTWGEDLASGV